MSDSQLSELLSVDPLATAETITGRSYKEDGTTEALGLLLHIAHCGARNEALLAADDTQMSNDVERYERILTDEGFKPVLVEPFVDKGYRDINEKLAVWWHGDGLLLKFDTFGGAEHHINAAGVYYNWKPNDEQANYWSALSSHGGRRNDGIYAGYHDAREALRFNLRRLRTLGSFVTPWVERPWLWLLHYSEKDRDYKVANSERIDKLPEVVRDAITPAN